MFAAVNYGGIRNAPAAGVQRSDVYLNGGTVPLFASATKRPTVTVTATSPVLAGVRLTESAHAGAVVVLSVSPGVTVTPLSAVPVDPLSVGTFVDLFNDTPVKLTLTSSAAGTAFVGDAKYVPARAHVRLVQTAANRLLALGASTVSV